MSKTSSPVHIRSLGSYLKTYQLRRKLVQLGDVERFYTRGRHEALSVVLESLVQSGLLPIFGKTETKTGL